MHLRINRLQLSYIQIFSASELNELITDGNEALMNML